MQIVPYFTTALWTACVYWLEFQKVTNQVHAFRRYALAITQLGREERQASMLFGGLCVQPLAGGQDVTLDQIHNTVDEGRLAVQDAGALLQLGHLGLQLLDAVVHSLQLLAMTPTPNTTPRSRYRATAASSRFSSSSPRFPYRSSSPRQQMPLTSS